VIVDDARSRLAATRARYDVIVGDLVVPWRQGEAALFTLEHFQAARRALAPGGLFCQWLPLFQLSEPELQVLLRTFLAVFPRAAVWRGDFSAGQPALALIGSAEPIELSPPLVARRLAELSPDPLNPQLADVEGFWMYCVGVLEADDLPRGDGRLNTEDRPWLELTGPLAHAGASAATQFSGRRLQAWEDELTRRSIPRLAARGEREAAGLEAGRALLELSLAMQERDDAAAAAAQERVRSLLPPRALAAIFQAPAHQP
jgi:spermidine synthase